MANPQIQEIDDGDEQFVDELKPGTGLMHGQYTIDSFLNAGGFGITYRAKDSLDRKVVIKECFPGAFCRRSRALVNARSRAHQSELESIVRLFVQEARNLSKLVHPNIVGVHQVFEENNTAYMALDFVEGRDLLEMIEDPKTPLKPEQIEQMLRDLLGAVGFVHEQGVLHRDISPDNILVDSDLKPVLIDFGAAREEATKKSRVLSALRVVKDGYSPQEFYIAGSEQGPFSDLYALGASFYHLITGEAPPASQARLASVASGQGDSYKPLVERDLGFPKDFLASVDKSLAVLPKDRLQSAEDWIRMMDGIEPAAKNVTALKTGRTAAAADPNEQKKSSMGLLLASAAVVALLGGGFVAVQSGVFGGGEAEVTIPGVGIEGVETPSAPVETAVAPSSEAETPTEVVVAPEAEAPAESVASAAMADVDEIPGFTEVPTAEPEAEAAVPVQPVETALSRGFVAPELSGAPVVLPETEIAPVELAVATSPRPVGRPVADPLVAPTGDTQLQIAQANPALWTPYPEAEVTPVASAEAAGPQAVGTDEVALRALDDAGSALTVPERPTEASVTTPELDFPTIVIGAEVVPEVALPQPLISDWAPVLPVEGLFDAEVGQTAIYSVNGVDVSTEAEFNAAIRNSVDLGEATNVALNIGTGIVGENTITEQNLTLPVMQETALTNGLAFRATYSGEAWVTTVVAVPSEIGSDMEVGDVVVAYLPTTETVESRTGMRDILAREIAAGVTDYNFAVRRGDTVWVTTFNFVDPSAEANQ